MGDVVTTASGGGGMGARMTGDGVGIDLVIVSSGAHNPPGALQGVLQPASIPAAVTVASPKRFFISIDSP